MASPVWSSSSSRESSRTAVEYSCGLSRVNYEQSHRLSTQLVSEFCGQQSSAEGLAS